jgi:hypothetical protein
MTIVQKTCKKVRYEVMHRLLLVSYRNNVSVCYVLIAGQQKKVVQQNLVKISIR